MKLRDGDRWADRIARFNALPPPLVNGAPRTPQLQVRFPFPDDRVALSRARKVNTWLVVSRRVV